MKIKILILTLITVIYTSVFVYKNVDMVIIDNKEPVVNETSNIMIGDKKYKTLQEAIDHAKDNDTINIYQTINENINIKNLSITINGNNNKILASTYIGENNNVVKSVIEIENSNVIINDLIIDGENGIDINKPNIGIYVNNSTIELNNISIININHKMDLLTHYPYGTCIYVVKSIDEDLLLKISGCSLTNFHQTGIYINNHSEGDYDIQIKDNLIRGIGRTLDVEQRGIVIYGNVSGEITNNTLEDIYYLNSISNKNYIIISDMSSLLIVDGNKYNN